MEGGKFEPPVISIYRLILDYSLLIMKIIVMIIVFNYHSKNIHVMRIVK